jgi:2-methylisocitrate lyase-like PEP mutase family enzyme
MLGWRVGKLSGSTVKAAYMALPDSGGVWSMPDLVDACRRVSLTANLGLIVDADDGGPSVLAVRRTVRELEAVGIAAIEIADSTSSGSLGSEVARKELLLPTETQVAKLRAAVDARLRSSTMIVARTSSLTDLPFDEALARIEAYGQTGVDAVMLPGRPAAGRHAIEEAHRVSGLPLFVLGLQPDEATDEAFLSRSDIRIRYVGQPTFRAVVRAIYESLQSVEPREQPCVPEEASLLGEVTRISELVEWERRYASG